MGRWAGRRKETKDGRRKEISEKESRKDGRRKEESKKEWWEEERNEGREKG